MADETRRIENVAKDVEQQFLRVQLDEAKSILLKQQMRISELKQQLTNYNPAINQGLLDKLDKIILEKEEEIKTLKLFSKKQTEIILELREERLATKG